MNDFQKTVNLKRQADEEREKIDKPAKKIRKKIRKGDPSVPRLRRDKESRAEAIDQVYQDEVEEIKEQKELHTISRPQEKPSYENLYKRIVMVLAIVIAVGAVYFLFFNNTGQNGNQQENTASRWYAVKLVGGEMYYGQIADTSKDPIVVKNVYYNYDQLNPGTDAGSESNNLKLIKRGKETYGPEGTMDIVRTQVVYMEPLKEDSKVLQAILNYEN